MRYPKYTEFGDSDFVVAGNPSLPPLKRTK